MPKVPEYPRPDGQEHSAVPKETACFPVTKEAVSRSLGAIAANPDRTLIQEGAIVQMENPRLNQGLMDILQTFPVEKDPYVEGALFTYRILREQAEIRGKKVPAITNASWSTYLHSEMERLEENPNATTFEYTVERMGDISAQDPELGYAVDELTKYRTGKEHFLHGVVNVYFPIKQTTEGQAMEQQFGGDN